MFEGVVMKMLLMAGAAALLMTTSIATAQSAASAGGIWDGSDHQPTRARTAQQEKAAGVAPTQSESHSDKTTVGQIDRQLLDRSPDSTMIGTRAADHLQR
jgi:hypothetical protein